MKVTWEFVQAGIGEWRWQKLDAKGNVLEKSRIGFVSKIECFEDACANGYTGIMPKYFKSLQIQS